MSVERSVLECSGRTLPRTLVSLLTCEPFGDSMSRERGEVRCGWQEVPTHVPRPALITERSSTWWKPRRHPKRPPPDRQG